MSVKIKLAETAKELDACYRLRHKVFVEGDAKYAPQPNRRLLDCFDAYGTSRLFIAYEEQDVVGTLRVSFDDPAVGFPADEYFDFRSHLSKAGNFASISQLAVDPSSRGHLRVLNGLMMLLYYWVHMNHISHVVVPFNPALTKVMQRIGFQKIGEVVKSDHYDLDIQPMILNLEDIRSSFIDFVARQDIVHFMEPYFREYFSAGETVISQGEIGDCAYFIINGSAEVTVDKPNHSNCGSVAQLGKGDIFGELSLVIDVQRTATVTATSDLEVMILSRKQFLECVQNDSENALFMIKKLSERLSLATTKMTAVTKLE